MAGRTAVIGARSPGVGMATFPAEPALMATVLAGSEGSSDTEVTPHYEDDFEVRLGGKGGGCGKGGVRVKRGVSAEGNIYFSVALFLAQIEVEDVPISTADLRGERPRSRGARSVCVCLRARICMFGVHVVAFVTRWFASLADVFLVFLRRVQGGRVAAAFHHQPFTTTPLSKVGCAQTNSRV